MFRLILWALKATVMAIAILFAVTIVGMLAIVALAAAAVFLLARPVYHRYQLRADARNQLQITAIENDE